MPPDVPIQIPVVETDSIERRSRALTDHLAGSGVGPVRWVEQTGSTNADLLEAADAGASAGLVCIADHQTSGRGRRDRAWVAAPGAALLMSVLQRSPAADANIAVAGAALGLAACEAVRAIGFESVGLKWPNDLVVDTEAGESKLAGVLAQSTIRGPRAVVVVGIGLNVRSEGLSTMVTDRPSIALSDLRTPPDRVVLAAAVLERFAAMSRGAEDFWDRYRAVSATIGSSVRITTDDEIISGIAVDVTSDGALLVDGSAGPRLVRVGDVESLR